MSLAQLHGCGPVGIETLGGASAVIGGITRQSAQVGAEIISQVENGENWSTHIAVAGLNPRMSFSTRDIRTALATIGAGGLCIDNDGGVNYGMRMAFRQRSCVGTAAGSVHRTITVGDGIMFPTSLSCDHQGDASLSVDVIPISSDGVTDAQTISDVGNLDTVVTATRDDQYTLYSLTIGSATVTGFTGVDISFGVNGRADGAMSDPYPTVASVPSVMPSITVRGLDLTWVKNSAAVCVLSGEPITHGNTSLVLKNRSDVIGSAVHMAFTLNGIVYPDVIGDASGEGNGTCTIMLRGCSADGTTAPLVVNTTYQFP